MSDRLSVAEWRQRQDENRDARRQEMDTRRESAAEEHKAAVDAQTTVEVEPFVDAGYEETLPGQVEVVAGSVQHEQLLNSFPNATSYGPDHNVVVPEPEPPPPPPDGDPAAQSAVAQEEEREYGR